MAGVWHLKIYIRISGITSGWQWIPASVLCDLKKLRSSLLFVRATSMEQQDFIAQ